MKLRLSTQVAIGYAVILLAILAIVVLVRLESQWVSVQAGQVKSQVRDAQSIASGISQLSSGVQERLDKAKSQLLALRACIAVVQTQRNRFDQAFLSNTSLANEDSMEAVRSIEQLITDFDVQVLVKDESLADWREQLAANNKLINQHYTHLKEQWLQQHEGLREQLLRIRRHYTYWTLKIANMMFVKSSIDELLPESAEDTELQFLASLPDYDRWKKEVPTLEAELGFALEADQKLYKAAKALDDLTFYGKWDEAHKAYRDAFPPLTKEIGVRLDNLIREEDYILNTQNRCVRFAVKQLDPVLQASLTTLHSLVENVEQFILRAQGEMITAQKEVNQHIVALNKGIDTFDVQFSGVADSVNRLEFEIVIAGIIATVLTVIIAYVITRKVVSNISSIMLKISGASSNVAQCAETVAERGVSLNESSQSQSATVEETTSTLTVIANNTDVNMKTIDQAEQEALQLKKKADQGQQEVSGLTESMTRLQEAIQESVSIINTIDSIAFETKLVALNAAIEASAAGQFGRSFAVVAEKVSELAERSAQASKRTSEIINRSQNTAQASGVTADKIAAVFGEFREISQRTADLCSEVNDNGRQQQLAIKEINNAVDALADRITENADNAMSSQRTVDELRGQVDSLEHSIAELGRLVKKSRESAQQQQLALRQQLPLLETHP